MRGHDAEIDIVARQPEADHARDDDGGDDQQRHALFIGRRQFLDREADPGERRVEGSRDTGRAARDHDRCTQRHLKHRMDAGEDGGGNLDRGAFAPDRCAHQQARQRQCDLEQRGAQVDQPPANLFGQAGGGDDLRNARSAGERGVAAGDPGDAGKTERGQDQWQPGPLPREVIEGFAAGVGRPRKEQRGEADENSAAHQRETAAEDERRRAGVADQRAHAPHGPSAARDAHTRTDFPPDREERATRGVGWATGCSAVRLKRPTIGLAPSLYGRQPAEARPATGKSRIRAWPCPALPW